MGAYNTHCGRCKGMAEAFDTLGMLYQNLQDAGCDAQTVQACMALAEAGNASRMLGLLLKHRATLCQTVRAEQKKVDCLDYLIYALKKGAENPKQGI